MNEGARPWDELVRSDRRTLAITVRPDLTVLVRAPSDADEEEIQRRVERRSGWIAVQRQRFEEFLPRTPPRRFLPGETHLYLGRQYRLRVASGAESVRLSRGELLVSVPDASPARVGVALGRWYEGRARAVLPDLVQKVIDHGYHGLPIPEGIEVRRMTRRWGSCTRAGRILLNADLIRASRTCIEYIVVHELCHLLHPDHSRRFYRSLDAAMPDWPARKRRLERLLL